MIPHDVDIVVPISPGLLVPKAESVEELVLNGSQAVAVTADGQLLLSHMPVSYRGVASTNNNIRCTEFELVAVSSIGEKLKTFFPLQINILFLKAATANSRGYFTLFFINSN